MKLKNLFGLGKKKQQPVASHPSVWDGSGGEAAAASSMSSEGGASAQEGGGLADHDEAADMWGALPQDLWGASPAAESGQADSAY